MLNFFVIYFLIGGNVSFGVKLNRRIFGLSYSSIDIPRDKRWLLFGLSFEPPELAEKVRERSTPGIATDVSNPWPLQNSKID